VTYSERLAGRIRRALAGQRDVIERQMMGGLCFMLRGHMCCGIVRSDLVVRVGPAQYEAALARPHARPMDFTGRPMRGFVFVGPSGYRTSLALHRWVTRGMDFVASLPAKQPK
jgi:hypothetical protein